MTLKLLNVVTGISAKSGKRYAKITVRGVRTDRGYAIADFWLNEDVANQLVSDGIQVDDDVVLSMSLDAETLRPFVSGIEKDV